MRIYVVNHSRTHRDKYVRVPGRDANNQGRYICFSCNLPPFMDCTAPHEVSSQGLKTMKVYNREATENEAASAEEALEAWEKL